MIKRYLSFLIVFLMVVHCCRAQSNIGSFNADTVISFPVPPAGFNIYRDDIPHGKLAVVQYDSKTLGKRREMAVYTPPGYDGSKKYPVLYLLHGLGEDDRQWTEWCQADNIADNLVAAGKMPPIIMVFPNCDVKLTVTDTSIANRSGKADEYAGYGKSFEDDLLHDLIPYIDSHYATIPDGANRALAGLSMGGGQSLNIGLYHLEAFSYIGGFSSAPNTNMFGGMYPDIPFIPDIKTARAKLRLLWIACGTNDALFHISEKAHQYLQQQHVPHVWHVDDHGHDNKEWDENLYMFCQQIFKPL